MPETCDMVAKVQEELCRWCSRRLVWVIGRGRSQVVDEQSEETRQTLLGPKSQVLEPADCFPQAPLERQCGQDESPLRYASTKIAFASSSTANISSQSDLPRSSRQSHAQVVDSTEQEVMRRGPRQIAFPIPDIVRNEVELQRPNLPNTAAHDVELNDLCSSSSSSSDSRRESSTAAKAFTLFRELSPGRRNEEREGTAKTISESTETLIQSFVHATERVREADFRENAANAVGTAAVVASSAGNAAVNAAEVMRSSLAHVGDKGVSETLSRGAVQAANTLHTTGRVAQQRVVEAKTVCQSHVPKAAAVAALAAGVAKDRFAKASHGFAGMFKKSQAAPTCRFCTSTMHWTDHAEGTYALGWSCENVNTCGSSSSSQGSWRWFCSMCQNHDLCTNCALQDGRKQCDSPPRFAPKSPRRQVFPMM